MNELGEKNELFGFKESTSDYLYLKFSMVGGRVRMHFHNKKMHIYLIY